MNVKKVDLQAEIVCLEEKNRDLQEAIIQVDEAGRLRVRRSIMRDVEKENIAIKMNQ